jgi:ribosome-associated translation inhibitor RaiA/cold shock CspA family protein
VAAKAMTGTALCSAALVLSRVEQRHGGRVQVPLEIAFHHIDKPDWAERAIRERVARLEDIFERMISCRVRVERRARNSNNTIPPVVRIEISVPGRKDIVVAHEPEHLQRKYQAPDLNNAINEAFGIAERNLAAFKDQLTDHTATGQHEATNEFLGQVAELHPERDFGFVLTKEGGLLYFHRNSVLSGNFDGLRRCQEVHYIEAAGDTGPIATKVRVKTAV